MATTWSMPTGSGDRWADDYERGRPGWPRGVADVAGLPPRASVLDLGAGTGKLTRVLASLFERVVAVEPAEAMRRVLTHECPHAEALAGSAQEIPLDDASVDAVFAGEAFHWFNDSRAMTEIVRVLRPRGALVLMWNVPAGAWQPSTDAAEELLLERGPSPDEVRALPLDLDGPQYTEGAWRRAFVDAPFERLRGVRFANPQTLDRDGLVAYYASMGWIGDLPDDERLPLLNEIRTLLSADEYRREWETHVHATRLRAT